MFNKSHYQTFTYYHFFHDSERWQSDLSELRAQGFSYVILAKGLDLKSVLASEDQKQDLTNFLDAVVDHQMHCILHVGNPRELYLLPDAQRWRFDYMRHVAQTIGNHPGVFGLLLEDRPTGGIQFSIDRWKSATAGLEGRLEADDLTEDGYQYQVKSWQLTQYADYITELARVTKKAKSRLKLALSFHLDALCPGKTLVQYQETVRALDFVIIDPGVSAEHDRDRIQYLTRWVANMAVTMTDRDIWMTVGAHVPPGRYETTSHELRTWTEQACAMGVSAIGWHGWNDTAWHNGQPVRGEPLSEKHPELWQTVTELSRSLTTRKRTQEKIFPHRCLLSYDSYTNQLPWLDVFATNQVLRMYGGLTLGYVSDAHLAGGERFQRCKMVFTTPCPSTRARVADRLLGFMKRGGFVVASADDFTLDEQLCRSDMRRRLFGMQQEKGLSHPDRILLTAGWPEVQEGADLSTTWHRTSVTAFDDDIQVLGRWGDGSAAIILKPHGKGGALYIGTNPYQAAMEEDRHSNWQSFISSIVEPDALQQLIENREQE
jgi:hypothetical protein